MTEKPLVGGTGPADRQGTLKGGDGKVSRSAGILIASEHKAKFPAALQEGNSVW